ncbi:MAG: cytochrome-c peroxidase [Lutibacter sp.]|jgi:cytochrome c peroxidase|nr:cytochrome-c peroxidase [Lutibacter sp.]
MINFRKQLIVGLLSLFLLLFSCSKDNSSSSEIPEYTNLSNYFSIDFNALPNYTDQYIPAYIIKDNTPGINAITNEGASLGRILFYDTNLSSNKTVSCASCHKQAKAFGDNNNVSEGINGETPRHSMRLVNSRFADENKFFWDERANSLEAQTTMPIQNHIEMGFSGEDGGLNFNDLITKLNETDYYPTLFTRAFGTSEITETRIQDALAQFVRSIQSFDSKYDSGRIQVTNDNQPFPNYTPQENQGKDLFLQPPVFDTIGSRIDGGVGCAGCHRAPEFDIDPNSLNNGTIGTADGTGTDLTITRAPSLRDVVKQNGESNGPFMHIGISTNLITVINHYDEINTAGNNNLDQRLRPNGNAQKLNMIQEEKDAVIAFIRTLSGTNVYIDEKWSNPFLN